MFFFEFIAQLVERQIFSLLVIGSNPIELVKDLRVFCGLIENKQKKYKEVSFSRKNEFDPGSK